MPIAKALELWTAQTLCDVGILLSVVSFLLHIGRPYFERILRRLTLRVAADLWWLIYVALRDGSLLVAVLFGFLHLNLDLMADIKIALPFVPLATVAMAVALVVKVFRDAEDMNRAYRRATLWTALGAFLNVIGYVFVMEAPGGEYEASRTVIWQTLHSWRSNVNPDLAVWTFSIAIVLLGGVAMYAAYIAMAAMRRAGEEGDGRVQA